MIKNKILQLMLSELDITSKWDALLLLKMEHIFSIHGQTIIDTVKKDNTIAFTVDKKTNINDVVRFNYMATKMLELADGEIQIPIDCFGNNRQGYLNACRKYGINRRYIENFIKFIE